MNSQIGKRTPRSEVIRRFGRNQPHVYRITVDGDLNPDWSDRLGGLRIQQLSKDDTDRCVTVLEGLIRDQSQLSGVLNALHDLRLSLLGVELNDPE